jgi:hypothetical protein
MSVFSTFYVGMDECRKTRQNYTCITDLARNAGLFRSLCPTDNQTKTWEEWVYEEKRKR